VCADNLRKVDGLWIARLLRRTPSSEKVQHQQCFPNLHIRMARIQDSYPGGSLVTIQAKAASIFHLS
jgi:hypothetical protein